jgi:phosphatidylglycerophosphate synthase
VFDRYFLPLQRRLLVRPARALHGKGIDADWISLAGLAVGALSLPLLAFGFFGAALAAILGNRLLDGLDGAVARIAGPTDRGAFADIAFDFLFYALVPLGFALHDPCANALPAAVLISAFVGTGSSFLAFAAIAAKRALTADDYPQKGIYYLGGLTEGAETIGVFILMCLVPDWFPALAYTFAALCAATMVLRWRQGWVTFGSPAKE